MGCSTAVGKQIEFQHPGFCNQGVQIWETPNGMAIAKFADEKKMQRVLEGGPWWFNKSPVLMEQWNGEDDPEELEFRRLKIWVQIHRLPWMLMSAEIAKDFAGVAGRVCRSVGAETDGLKRRFVRCQIEVDVTEPLRKGCFMHRENRAPLWIAFKYERLQEVCSSCGTLRHGLGGCIGDGTRIDYGSWLRADTEEIWVSEVEERADENQGRGEYGPQLAGAEGRKDKAYTTEGDVGCHLQDDSRQLEAMRADKQQTVPTAGVSTKDDKGKQAIGLSQEENMALDNDIEQIMVGED